MNVTFRVDASIAVGTGHLMRCLTLAGELAARGSTCTFLTRRLPASLEARILARGFGHFLVEDELGAFVVSSHDAARTTRILAGLEHRPAWLIVDHYGIDEAWERQIKSSVDRILVIDDLANRRHACDLLLDQNHADPARYQGLVAADTQLLLGPGFVLLRPEFSALASRVTIPEQLRRLFVFYGGTDPTHETSLAVDALLQTRLKFDKISIVVGADSPPRNLLMEKIERLPGAILHENVDNIAELILEADCALGSGGSNIWERSALGVPSLVTITAENQRELTLSLAAAGAIRVLGEAGEVNSALIARSLEELSAAPAALQQMSRAGSALTALDGCAKVVDAMMLMATPARRKSMDPLASAPQPISIRRAVRADSEDVFRWRNSTAVREASFDQREIPLDDHNRWFQKTIESNESELLIAHDDAPIGVLRFDIDGTQAIISVYLVPERIGTGLGSSSIAAGVRWLKRERPEVQKVIAQIRPANQRSQSAFLRAGFSRSGEDYVFDFATTVP